MYLKNRFSTIAATTACLLAIGFCGSAFAQSTKTDAGQPNNSPGLATGFLSSTGLSTGGAIGSAAASFAGGGPSGNAGLNVNRFALSRETGAAGAAGGEKWNAWVAYSHNNVSYDYAPLSSSGHVNVYLGGVDYTFDNNVVFGVAVAADRTSVDQHFNGGNLNGSGTTIAPYIGYAINRNLVFDATVGFGRTTVDTNILGVTGSGKDDRTIGTLGLTYRHVVDKWQFTGRGALLSVHDKLGAYTLSNGILVSDGSVNLTQVRLIGQVAYSAGSFTPYASISYINDLNRPDQAPVGGIAAANDKDAWTPAVGVRFKSDGALYGSVQYSSERGRSEVKNNQFLISAGIRF